MSSASGDIEARKEIYVEGKRVGYAYDPLPGERWIRVLVLHPAEHIQDILVANLEILPLGDPQPPLPSGGDGDYKSRIAEYQRMWDKCKLPCSALSYSWAMQDGDAAWDCLMILNTQSISITRNLTEGLRYMRSKSDLKRLWVDAVCIDQGNMIERSSQVSMMFDIYRMVSNVIIWLDSSASRY